MGKFKPDPTDPVATAKGLSRRQRRAAEVERMRKRVEGLEAAIRKHKKDVIGMLEEFHEGSESSCYDKELWGWVDE